MLCVLMITVMMCCNMSEHNVARNVCACGLAVAFLCTCTVVLMRAAFLSSPKQLQMSAMEAIAAVRKERCGNTKAKSASDDCADLAAYREDGDPPKVRRSILEARKKDPFDRRMHHKQSVTTPDYVGWLDDHFEAESKAQDEQ